MNMPVLCDQSLAVRAGEELDLTQLSSYLAKELGGGGQIAVEQFPAGHSNLTYRVIWNGREMVLRRPPFGSKVKSAHDMGREFRVLSRLHHAYAAAPETVLYCDDPEIIGAPFYLMEPIHGVILRRQLPAGVNLNRRIARRLSENFLDKLVELHALDYSAVGLADLGKPQGYLERQVKGWIERYHNSSTHDLPEVERICAWLFDSIPESGDAALIHNDYKYDNIVLDPSEITKIIGVLDWEMCTVGDPLSDLGTALAYWTDPKDPAQLQEVAAAPTTIPGTLTRAELAERYARLTGRNVGNMVFYLTFARFKVGVIIQQIYYRYAHGLTHDERFAHLPNRISVLMKTSLQCMESGVL
jgi:aminoglycoside phosphotransferase (APT) family kinase protein